MKLSLSPRFVGIVTVVFLIVAAVAFAGISYTQASADCGSCHTPEGTVASAGTHASVSCSQCHAPAEPVGKIGFGADVVLGMRLRVIDVADTAAGTIPNSRCTACHEVAGAGVVGSAVRINHDSCAPGDTCVRCHDSVVHTADQRVINAIDMFECLDCHTRRAVTNECDTCHPGRLPRERVKTGSFAVTHGKNWERNHGLGSIAACAACHTDTDCGDCHGVGVPHGQGFKTSHGAFATAKGAECSSCHRDQFCTSCHGLEMPHPKGFKQQHAEVTGVEGRAVCQRCHADSDCTTCHEMHVHPGGAIGTGRQ